MNNWKDLHADVRKALLRGEPAADPEIDRIAREHAEQALGRSSFRRVLVVLPFAGAIGVALGLLQARADMSPAVLAGVFAVLSFGYIFVEARRRIALVRLVNVSGAPRAAVAAGGAERLEIRVPVLGVLRMLAPLLLIVASFLVGGAMLSNAWLIGIGVVLAIPVLAYAAYWLYWSLGRHAFVIDADGFTSPDQGLRLGWDAVTELRVLPLRASARDTRQVLTFILRDNQEYLRQLPRWEALLVSVNTKAYLSPLVLLDGLIDTSIDAVAETAVAVSGLPVTRVPRGN
ncbi:hypothetical protein ACWIGI_07720 [Nocardia sp. NPDC055321]